jgi:deazaflavin-dependent oxidoreductase (nitroreductase family)
MADGGGFRPAKRYRPGRWRRLENIVMTALVAAGAVPHSYVLTTRGHRTGRTRRNPVIVVELDGRRWLVAPYGVVSWVRNARASGRVSVRRRGQTRNYTIRQAPAEQAGPVLKRYIAIASATRGYFQADRNDPVESFVAEAEHHPVFELVPISADSTTGQPPRAG